MNVVKGLLLAIILALLFGCSTYDVRYREVNQDGSYIETRVHEKVPPGGKKLSEGIIKLEVNDDGSWSLEMGAEVDTDAVGTQELIDSAIEKAAVGAATMGVVP